MECSCPALNIHVQGKNAKGEKLRPPSVIWNCLNCLALLHEACLLKTEPQGPTLFSIYVILNFRNALFC